MEIKNLSNSELLVRTERLVKSERKLMHLVLCHIAEVESRKLYADLGYDSMYSYLTQKLGYCESSAYSRLQGAKLLRNIPEVAEKLESGILKFSQLTQVQKCLKHHKQTHGEAMTKSETLSVIEKIEAKNSYQTQTTLAAEFQLPIQIQEKVKPQRDDSVRLEVTLSQEQFAELKHAKDLLSHLCPDGSWGAVIAHLAKAHNKKKLFGSETKHKLESEETIQNSKSKKISVQDFDGTLKLDTSVMTDTLAALNSSKTSYTLKNSDSSELLNKAKSRHLKISSKAKLRVKRSNIKITTRRALLKKAQGCCEYRDAVTGKKCDSRYQLQVDHILPLALGGGNEVSNFRILCRTHNLWMARKFGLDKISNGALRF